MSYELLTSLYYGETSNADLVDEESRRRLHVRTPLDDVLPELARRGLSIVLTGNPGDGKSHLVRKLEDDGALGDAVVELDLSAKPTVEIVDDWARARAASRPYILCANQGPLAMLIEEMAHTPTLAKECEELRAQLGAITVARGEILPREPSRVILIDLADRNLLDVELLESAISGICTAGFLPKLSLSIRDYTSSGRNIWLFARSREAKTRLARLLAAAGRRAGGHFTFRHIWGAVAFALSAAKKESTLQSEYYAERVGVDTFPISYLTRSSGRNRGKGPLIDAVRTYADPAAVPAPDLDEEIWSRGAPRVGRWLDESIDDLLQGREPPAKKWARGEEEEALEDFRHLKRLVALAHDHGEELIDALLGAAPTLPSALSDDELKALTIEGIQRLYLTSSEQRAARPWLRDSLCLWVSHTFLDTPGEERAHVAVTSLQPGEFEILRPQRVPWLAESLGPPLELAWLSHEPSGIALRLEPELLAVLDEARTSDGPITLPERVQRFLTQLAGWEERQDVNLFYGDNLAVLERPRGQLTVVASINFNMDDRAYYAD